MIGGAGAPSFSPALLSFVILQSIPSLYILMPVTQMGLALFATGWWMFIDVPQTPDAVVICVVIFNAAFGFR